MKRTCLISILFGLQVIYANSQDSIVTIPDDAFLNALIDVGVDTNEDGKISLREAENVNNLSFFEIGITDLTGIEAFVNIDTFDCSWNPLNSLDVSNNTALKFLGCRGCQLTSLDVSKNTELTSLICFRNQLDNLDVSKNTALTELSCEGNQLTSLTVTGCLSLTDLVCGIDGFGWDETNPLTTLDLSNNTNLNSLDLRNIPSLGEVCVWEGFDEGIAKTHGSPNVNFTSDCLYDSIVYIPDTAFLYALIDEGVDTNGDSLISNNEAEVVTSLDVSEMGITDMTGIEAFINLDSLLCNSNTLINLDVSNCMSLSYLDCAANQLISLNVSGCIGLKRLNCGSYYDNSGNLLTELDVSNNTALETLFCASNQLTSLDLKDNRNLEILYCRNNQLTGLDLSNMTALFFLNCSSNMLTSLNVSNDTSLIGLLCSDNLLTSLDVTTNINLEGDYGMGADYGLFCDKNLLTTLDISNNKALYYLRCHNNILTSLDISNNTNLGRLFCHNNQLSSLDISANEGLEVLDLSEMGSLKEVCVWDGFSKDSLDINITDSPNICFQPDCNGICSEGIILSVSADTIYQPVNLEATSSADGKIYLVPVDTETDIHVIRSVSMDSVEVVMNTPVSVPLEGLENGTYWMVATDTADNISEPQAFTIIGVGIEENDVRSLRIYPNPVNTLLTIEINTIDLINVTITSINGQLMLDRQLQGTSHQLDLSSFQKGVYFITIRSKESTITRKIVKL